MKKSHTRTVLLTLAITASLASYLFLSCVSANTAISGELVSPGQIEEVEEDNVDRSVLPELILIKKVIDVGKRLVPAS